MTNIFLKVLAFKNYNKKLLYLPCDNMVMTFKQTYSSIRNLTRRNISVT